jgi:proteasome lid subunit RPN8/RPN11
MEKNIILLTYPQLQEMIQHAKSSPHKEICGAMMGIILNKEKNIYRFIKYIPIDNVAGIGVADYIMDGNQLLHKVLMESNIHGNPASPLSFVGVFHNHPYWRPIPSEMDKNGAGFAGVYIIYSNLYDDVMAWYNEGSDDHNITTAMYDGQIGFGPAYICIR